jgi:hypothetical protein
MVTFPYLSKKNKAVPAAGQITVISPVLWRINNPGIVNTN